MAADYNPNDPQLIWRKGFPPHTGWWNASSCKNEESWRWFDKPAKTWSEAVSVGDTMHTAAHWATFTSNWSRVGNIKWRTYYPANARVPRINPGAKA